MENEDFRKLNSPSIYRDFLAMVIEQNGGKCPSCGHQLCLPPSKIEVAPFMPSTAKTFSNPRLHKKKEPELLSNSFNRLLHRNRKKEKGKSCPVCGSPTKHYDWCPFASPSDPYLVVEKRK